jgi:hypothetical protein
MNVEGIHAKHRKHSVLSHLARLAMASGEDKDDTNAFIGQILSIISSSQPNAGDARALCGAVRRGGAAPGCR